MYIHGSEVYFQFSSDPSKVFIALIQDDDVFYSVSGVSAFIFLALESGTTSISSIKNFLVNFYNTVDAKVIESDVDRFLETLLTKTIIGKSNKEVVDVELEKSQFLKKMQLNKNYITPKINEELLPEVESGVEIAAAGTTDCPTVCCGSCLCP